VCGKKRGFRRLFDAINVATPAAPARNIDHLIRPMQEHRDVLRQGREAQAAQTREMRDRQAAANLPIPSDMPRGAAGIMSAISPDSKQWSQAINVPVINELRMRGKPRPIIVGNDPTPLPGG